jgi:hypothetical protein
MSDSRLFLMIITGYQRHWLPLKAAGVAFDAGTIEVKIGGVVIDGEGPERPITDEERSAIANIADEHSARGAVYLLDA